jgi:hypothetical protein
VKCGLGKRFEGFRARRRPAPGAALAADRTDYDGDRRTARVECEVDFDGNNEVTAFRQLGESGGGAFDDLLRDLLGEQ